MSPLDQISREEAATIMLLHEQMLRDRTLGYARSVLETPLPPSLYGKLLSAGHQYGPFDISQDWYQHFLSEIQDAVSYAAFMMIQQTMTNHPTSWREQLLSQPIKNISHFGILAQVPKTHPLAPYLSTNFAPPAA